MQKIKYNFLSYIRSYGSVDYTVIFSDFFAQVNTPKKKRQN